jgi:hypothetical protein
MPALNVRELPFGSALSSEINNTSSGDATLTMSEAAEVDLGRAWLLAAPTTTADDGTDTGSTSGDIDLEVTSVLVKNSIELLGAATSPSGGLPWSAPRGVARLWNAGKWNLDAGETLKITTTNTSGQKIKFAFGTPALCVARRENQGGVDFTGLTTQWASSPAVPLAASGSATATITFQTRGVADFDRAVVFVQTTATAGGAGAVQPVSSSGLRFCYISSIKDINQNELLLGKNSPHIPAGMWGKSRDFLWCRIGSQPVSNNNTFKVTLTNANADTATRLSFGVPIIPDGGVSGQGCRPKNC